ncbi:hypothetical protein SAMN04489719_2673 [Agrococcus carbonis]|uniref:C-type cytochrome biogenesis protein CcsB n=1 Tax=Agrococcus carbonis TaxID=684552 RepID=A0A1H1TGW4_9MICO|nr:hypothetical protein SAMN04489719_2673 [Agrococcus carbonis]
MPVADLDSYSLLLVYSAMAVYTLAFIAYAIDVARRSATKIVPAEARMPVGAGAPTSAAEPTVAGTPARQPGAAPASVSR